MALYDDFATGSLDATRWMVGEIRAGETLLWRYLDPALQVTVADGAAELAVPQFTLKHDSVQMFDNPKALYLSTRAWDAVRPLSCRCELAASFTGDTADYRNGFASFNVLDFATGTVMDIVANGRRLWAITERLDIPGLTSDVPPYSEVVDLGIASAPLRRHQAEVRYDPQAGLVQYFVDGTDCYSRSLPTRPQQLMLGIGLITLYPLKDGRSASCRGQGGTGRFAQIAVD